MILALTAGYSIVVGGLVWSHWGNTPSVVHAALVWTSLANWGLTMALLATIHGVVWRRLVRPLTQRADYDALTGVCRAEAFWSQADGLTQQLAKERRPWAFVYLDLDNFKQVNDTAGHYVGDTVLRAFGTLLQTHARHDDLVGRLGGEEFGWMLVNCSVGEAVTAVTRLLTAFRATPCEGLPPCSFSAGVAGWTDDAPVPSSVWDIARQADHALYAAKAQGKGRVQAV